MEHIVLLDAASKELKNLLEGKKQTLIRGAMGKKIPYGKVKARDVLYLAENDGKNLIQAKAVVSKVTQPPKLGKEQSVALVSGYEPRLMLSKDALAKYAGKRHLVIVEVGKVEALDPAEAKLPEGSEPDGDWFPIRVLVTK